MGNKYFSSLAHFVRRFMVVCLWDGAMRVSHFISVSSLAGQTHQVKKMRENSSSTV